MGDEILSGGIDVNIVSGTDAEMILEEYFDVSVETESMPLEAEDTQRFNEFDSPSATVDFWATTDFAGLDP